MAYQFSTTIKRSLFFIAVSVRKTRGVEGDYVGAITQGTRVTGEISFNPNTPGRDVWMRLTAGKWAGYWIALVDIKGKIFADPLPVDPNIPPVEDRYAFVEHGVNSKYMGYKNYMDWRGFHGSGDPSVYQWIATKTTKVIYMTRQIQELVFSFNVASAEGTMTMDELKKAWANLTAWNKALNNKKGTKQGFADYIRGVNLNAKQGLGAQNVIITGSTIKLFDNPYKKYGGWCQDFELADVLDPMTLLYTWKTHWHLIPAVTNSYRAIIDKNPASPTFGQWIPDKNGRGEIIGPFPKMRGDRSSFWLYMGLGTNRGTMYADALRYLDYVPSRPLWPYLNAPPRNIGDYESFWDMRYAT